MSINATKGVEVGSGFSSVSQKGTEHGDEMDKEGFKTNNAGGILGGISTGQDIEVSVAFKLKCNTNFNICLLYTSPSPRD